MEVDKVNISKAAQELNPKGSSETSSDTVEIAKVNAGATSDVGEAKEELNENGEKIEKVQVEKANDSAGDDKPEAILPSSKNKEEHGKLANADDSKKLEAGYVENGKFSNQMGHANTQQHAALLPH